MLSRKAYFYGHHRTGPLLRLVGDSRAYPQPTPSSQPVVDYGIITNNDTEASLVDSLQKAGVSQQQVETALDNLRAGNLTVVPVSSGRQLLTNVPTFGFVDETQAPFTPEERSIALLLAGEGRYVAAVPVSTVSGVKTPDALVDNVPTEFKTPDPGATNATIVNRVQESITGAGQARNFIIDIAYNNPGFTEAEGEIALARITGQPRNLPKLESIRIIGNGFDITRQFP